MTKISDEIIIRDHHIKNRIVMPPMVTFSFHGDNGSYYGKQHIEHYTECAKGGAGLIIVQATNVSGAVQGTNLWTEDNKDVLSQIVSNCHKYGAVVMIQLSYGDMDINILSSEQIYSMQQDMKRAAKIAYNIGFDGVEYHFAHGFTLCKFLDGKYNKREDLYGGTIENRVRILTEILPEIRKDTGDRFIISLRMGEYLPQSKDGIEAAKAFESAGIDLLHISFGMNPQKGDVPEDFQCSFITYSACRIKEAVNIPVIAVNEIRTEEQVRFLIENDYVDLVSIGRGMLADYEFANHVINSKLVNKCFGCKKCFWFTDHTKCPARK
ncbi:NADH:flavin oxidoreductase [Clostridium sp.]|jgi:2,4-dienoyl-CoA reductase-like NADH-dependent reductase (Old Yellow Enzyme family)|uniref:NADH:flavin oxidoreductase n=1 Tax=Clostridium sp. TaxID=1506 RepID=UPI0025881622|nr:NADH:flavin oxidoreductase [Clostridium sp.]MDF2503258.1 NADH-dependent flavine oxidoreductase [Clostridium sp.]